MAIRSRNIYKPDSEKPFKLSRSKVDNFVSCKRCFYIDRRLGVGHPPGFPFNINSAVDELLKKEFDQYREAGKPHPYMDSVNRNLIPYKHDQLDEWRENFKGVQFLHKKTNLLFTGAVDDVWFDTDSEELVVVDYKAQSSTYPVTVSSYLDAEWHLSYKLQMDIYVHILRKMDFDVSDRTFFYVCNGEKTNDKFDNKIDFKTTLIPYRVNTSWIEEKLIEMKDVLNLDKPPETEKTCEKCAYLEGGKKFK